MSGLSHRFWLTLLLSLAALLPLIPSASGAAPPAGPAAVTAPERMPPSPHLPPDVLARMRQDDARKAGQWRSHENPVRSKGKEGKKNSPALGVVQPLVSGTMNMPCVLIKFPDQDSTYTTADFQNMLFTADGIATGSARDFYLENSYGQMTLAGQATGWYTANGNKANYGETSGNSPSLVLEAAQKADAAGFNWAPYDNNHDGYVDTLWVVHSGLGCEESGNYDDIWSHSWGLYWAGLGVYTTSTPDPYHPGEYLKINRYIMMPETSYWSGGGGSTRGQVGIGVFCHEFGHALGLPDLYDTAGTGEGVGNASLMSGGSWGGNGGDSRYPAHLDAWCKADLGWLTPTVVTTNGSYTVSNVETNQSCYLVQPLGNTVPQYFLVENRQHVGFDSTLFATGLFIYHIDTDIIDTYRASNRINVNSHAYGVALEEADATTDSYSSQHLFVGTTRGYSTDSWPNGSKVAFTESSVPSTKTNAGVLRTCGITDMPAKSNAMTVNIYVVPANTPPTAADDTYSTSEDVPLTVTAPGVLSNDSDVNGDALTAVKVDDTTNGAVTLNSDGSFTYAPAANFNGNDYFSYRASDGTYVSTMAWVTISVTAVNDVPVAVDDSYSTNEDTPLTITAPGVLGNDSDVEGTPLTAIKLTNPANGSVTLNSNGSLTYTPNANFNGADSFTYKVSDGAADSNVATVTMTVTPVNDPPVAVDDGYTTPQETELVVPAPGVLWNDTDAEGDALSTVKVSDPSFGDLTFNADGSFSYTPQSTFSGIDSFTYRANDGAANSNVAIVTIYVTVPDNNAPVAVNDAFSTAEDTELTVSAPGILQNDSDADGDPLTAGLVTGPAYGLLALDSDGGFTYTPGANVNGADSFTYVASDGVAISNTATVTITVTPANDPPAAADDAYTTAEDTPLTVAAPGILGNDADVDGDPLTAVLVAGPTSGLLALNSDGGFTYTPDVDFNGADSFTYQANDGTANSNTATVSITVTAANDPPVANAQSVTTDEDTAVAVTLTGSDPDGDPLTFTVETPPGKGTLEGTAPNLTYTPAANVNGADSFTFRANDGTASSDPATVSITINAVNDAPVAADGALATPQDTPAGGTFQCSDVDGDPMTCSIVTNGAKGTAAITANDAYTYTPNAGATGEDSFTFKASDGLFDSNIATISVSIMPVSGPPVAADDAYSTAEDTALTMAAPGVLGNDSDPNGDPLTAVLVIEPTSGTLALAGNGGFTYTPDANFNGADSFTYKANDGTADSNVATVSITVTPVNDAPVVQNGVLTVAFNTPGNGTFLCSDADGDPMICSIVGNAAKGTVAITGDVYTYTPNADATGEDSFTFKASDGLLDSNVGTITVTIGQANRPPVALNDVYKTNRNGRLTVGDSGVLRNDRDWERARLTAVLVDSPQHGVLTLKANGSFTYVADAGYLGIDTFTYRASDGSLLSNTATVFILVLGKKR